jgi:hypothetical protein
MNFLIAAMRSHTLVKMPRWMAWRPMMQNHTSTAGLPGTVGTSVR